MSEYERDKVSGDDFLPLGKVIWQLATERNEIWIIIEQVNLIFSKKLTLQLPFSLLLITRTKLWFWNWWLWISIIRTFLGMKILCSPIKNYWNFEMFVIYQELTGWMIFNHIRVEYQHKGRPHHDLNMFTNCSNMWLRRQISCWGFIMVLSPMHWLVAWPDQWDQNWFHWIIPLLDE